MPKMRTKKLAAVISVNVDRAICVLGRLLPDLPDQPSCIIQTQVVQDVHFAISVEMFFTAITFRKR